MTEESARKRGVVVLHSDQSHEVLPAYPDEDEWRVFLESPLTAASKAMMSVNGDEEAAGGLGLLYDYQKQVPRDKKCGGIIKTEPTLSEETDPNKMNFLVPYQDALLTMTPLRNVPLHTVLQGSPSPGRDKRGGSYPESIATLPAYPGGLDGSLHAFPPAAPPPPPHSSQSDSLGFRAPDSAYSEQVFPLSEEIQRLTSISQDEYGAPYCSDGSPQFQYVLEAPQSLRPKSPCGPLSYLNKGQFYPISLQEQGGARQRLVRSVVMLVFGEEKLSEDQLRLWRFWQSRQHTAKQRCIDIADYKESFNTISNIEEVAYNAVSFTWDCSNEARVFVAVNCLSTDFSSQKGVRGQPLNLQIDTYVCGNHGDRLVHRAISQVKVFCDKGAERKIRDEERKRARRRLKGPDASATHEKELQHYVDVTVFKTVSDLSSQPVLFIPESLYSSHRHAGQADEADDSSGQKRLLRHGGLSNSPHSKRLRSEETQRVLLYVRREEDEVFDALMLRSPTLSGLLEAVTEKYELPSERIGKVYKRCKKGMLVNMDDNVIRSYRNEDTFHMQLEEAGGQLLLTLTEI